MRSVRIIACSLLILTVALVVGASDKQSGSSPTSNLHFTVLKDDNNKPVRNASVILHPVGKDGKQAKGGFQLKTDSEGKATSEGLPYGLIRVQVLAPGFQTFGDDYQINQPETEIGIRLKRPSDQLSIYDKAKDKNQTTPNPPPAGPKPQ